MFSRFNDSNAEAYKDALALFTTSKYTVITVQ